MNKPQQNAPGDWRKGGYRDAYELIPRPPRKPTALAQELIHSYQGSQRALRIIGLVFLGLSIPILLFFGDGMATDVTLSLAGTKTSGTITGTRTVTSVRVNDEHPIEIKYRFFVDEKQYEGKSYARTDLSVTRMQAGDSTPVEMLPIAPSVSRAQGTTTGMMGMGALFLLLFPAAGAILFGLARRSNAREIRAFRDGIAIKGLVVKRDFNENTEINGKNPYEVIWEFHVDGTRYTGKLSHMEPEALDKAIPTDEVTVLYDALDPKVNTVWLE